MFKKGSTFQIVNRVGEGSDEDILITDADANKQWSVRKDAIQFPIVSSSSTLQMQYTRTRGNPEVVLLVLFLDGDYFQFSLQFPSASS
ncbi:unnamed protein product [Anisakis simplex]|uniref:Ricin B-type lectin domain-containing protein n=1 Tax=Anisakis simplex TaxID=6269 RepID=A0A0M3JFM5_ANISI|nr:unnamed protein product [Anisakis simplex]